MKLTNTLLTKEDVDKWCVANNYSDAHLVGLKWWAFPFNGVMSVSIDDYLITDLKHLIVSRTKPEPLNVQLDELGCKLLSKLGIEFRGI